MLNMNFTGKSTGNIRQYRNSNLYFVMKHGIKTLSIVMAKLMLIFFKRKVGLVIALQPSNILV